MALRPRPLRVLCMSAAKVTIYTRMPSGGVSLLLARWWQAR